MSNTDFLGRAIDVVKKAIETDNEGEYEKAYQLYYSALELFMLALKWEKNARSKDMIRAKAGEYMDRAEKLKTHLASADGKQKPSAVGANGSVAHGSGKGNKYVFLAHDDISVLCVLTETFLFTGRKMRMIMKTPTQRSYDPPLREQSCRINPM